MALPTRAEFTGYSGVATFVRKSVVNLDSISQLNFCELQAGTMLGLQFHPLSCAVPGAPDEGRCLLTRHGSVALFNVYTPNGGQRPQRPRLSTKMRFLAGLFEAMQQERRGGYTVLLVGDLNIAHGHSAVYPSTENEGDFHRYSREEIMWMDAAVGPACRLHSAGAGAPPPRPSGFPPSQAGAAARHCACDVDGAPQAAAETQLVATGAGSSTAGTIPTWLAGMLGKPLVPLAPQLGQRAASSAQPPAKAARQSGQQQGAGSPHAELYPVVDYVDVFRATHPVCSEEAWRGGLGQYTCFDQRRSHRLTNKGVRIDYVFCSTPSADGRGADSESEATSLLVGRCDIVSTPANWSDHLLLRCELQGPCIASALAATPAPTDKPGIMVKGSSVQCGRVSRSAKQFLSAQRQKLHPSKGSSSLLSFFKVAKPSASPK